VHDGVVAPSAASEDGAPPPSWSRPLGARIGSGGFAAVWEIEGGGALKVAHADHDLARARMRREAEALAAIGTPAVPRVDDHGVLPDGRAWIAMERIEGTNLADLLATGPMRISHATAIGEAILTALARVHAAGFVHRDLKPDNIVRRAGGAIVLLDLGLARRIPLDPDDPTRAGVQVGSLEYMPPEQLIDAASVGPRGDIYAFGCVLYELCTGRPPFVGDPAALERAHAALRPPPLGALANVPPALEAFVHDCIAKLPDRRPSSVLELRAQLLAMRDATPSLQRAQHSVSVIREGKQPVVLLWAELPRVERALLGMLAARKIAVVSQRGRRVLGGVAGADHADPAGAAIAAARDLAAAGARVALHLDLVHVRPRAGATSFAGPPIEQPESWLPAAPWTGIVVTRALAAVIQTPTRASELGPGFAVLGDPSQQTELFGRDALLADLAADAAAALAGAGPAIALGIGEHGIGKTALAHALVARLRELRVRVHVAEVPPPGSGRPSHAGLAELIGTPEGPIVRAVGDALRAAARARPTVLIVDDLHLADHELLDALEYATLGGEPLPLWILALATPRLAQRRPGFGARAERHRQDVLAPLDEDAAVALTAALLRPAEYPPLRALRQIAAIARGNPMHLATLVREIHDRGAIRSRPNGEHFLDTTALDALPPVALGPWLAARELASLSVELVALARVCAVLGDEIERAELGAVVEAVDRRGGPTTTIDVDVGLRELTASGILVASAHGWAFRQALLQDGVYATTDETERRAVHQAALEYWGRKPADDTAVAERVARHAEAVGDRPRAARAFAILGAHAQHEHRVLDADQAWQGAVRNLEARDGTRARALLGRAKARALAQRIRDALADLDEAAAIVRELDAPELALEIMLEQARALDFHEEFARSKALSAEAERRLAADPVRLARFALDVEFAAARGLFRDGNLVDAEPRLRATFEAARAGGRRATQIDAGLLLGPALAALGKLDEAEALSGEMIALCERADDRFHLCAAFINRTWVWSARGDIERVADDLRRVIQLAREGGQAHLERAATYNLAEDRLWQGAVDEALRLARRSLSLQESHGEGMTHLDLLLLARVHAARDAGDELAATLARLAAEPSLTDDERVVLQVLQEVRHPGRAADALLAEVERLPSSTQLEMWSLLARAGQLSPERRGHARALAATDPIWSRRRDEL